MASVAVCISTDCATKKSECLVRDIEELVKQGNGGDVKVSMSACTGKCGRGPNVNVVLEDGDATIHEGVKTWKKVVELFGDENASAEDSKVGALKYEARRDGDAAVRLAKIEEALAIYGGEKNTSKPEVGQLLVMRSKERMDANSIAEAVTDARSAVQLLPNWAYAHEMLARTLEKSGIIGEAVQQLREAMGIGNGVDVSGLKRLMKRWEREAKAKAEAPTPEPAAAPAKAKPVSKGQETKKAQGKEANAKLEEKIEMVLPDEIPEFVDWKVEKIEQLNHDCVAFTLRLENTLITTEQAKAVTDSWHVDFLIEDEEHREIRRAYTPVSNIQEYREGKLVIMIKVYEKGQMTSRLAKLVAPCPLLVTAPLVTHDLSEYKGFVFVAGGSAVTVALQFSQAVLKRRPAARIHIFMCNRTVRDVLYREQFDELMRAHPTVSVVHCLSSGVLPTQDRGRALWHPGRLNGDIVARSEGHLPVLVSGPAGLSNTVHDLWLRHGRDVRNIHYLDEQPVIADIESRPVEAPDEGVEKPCEDAAVLKKPEPAGFWNMFGLWCGNGAPTACSIRES